MQIYDIFTVYESCAFHNVVNVSFNKYRVYVLRKIIYIYNFRDTIRYIIGWLVG